VLDASHQLIELFLTFDRVDVVRVKSIDGVFAFDANVFGQMVGAGNANLQALGDFAGQFVEHADGPISYGQTQPAHFRQFHIVVVVVVAGGHVDIDDHQHHRRRRRQSLHNQQK